MRYGSIEPSPDRDDEKCISIGIALQPVQIVSELDLSLNMLGCWYFHRFTFPIRTDNPVTSTKQNHMRFTDVCDLQMRAQRADGALPTKRLRRYLRLS